MSASVRAPFCPQALTNGSTGQCKVWWNDVGSSSLAAEAGNNGRLRCVHAHADKYPEQGFGPWRLPSCYRSRAVDKPEMGISWSLLPNWLVTSQKTGTLLFDGQTDRLPYASGGLPSFRALLRERDPVVITRGHSVESAELEEVHSAWEEGRNIACGIRRFFPN